MKTPTLAEKLGDAPHDSPLLRKAERLGLGAEQLEHLAIQRGCDYYHDGTQFPPAAINEAEFSNEELAVALLSCSRRPSPRAIRLAAALIGAPEARPDNLARLATQENRHGLVRYIAQCGLRFEPENRFWSTLVSLLPEGNVDLDQLPHPTRFIEMTGIDRGRVGLRTRWIRPRRRAIA